MAETGLAYRVVTDDGRVLGSNSNAGGVYDTLGWAKNALKGFKGTFYRYGRNKLGLKIQYAEVEWHDLQEEE